MIKPLKPTPKYAAYCAAAIILSACSPKPAHTITVTNPADFDRIDEIAEVSPMPSVLLDTADDYVLTDAEGNMVQYQITGDGSMIFPASVRANQSAVYYMVKGTPAPADSTLAYVVRPDCQDDFAWENEHSGYRLYGPSFKRGGGKVHGYDIWCKRTPDLLVKRFYDLDHGPEHISYHVDHGEGFDGYTVGPTLGAGMNALVIEDDICYPTAYDDYEVIADGPLRIEVVFTVDSIPFGMEADGETPRYITEKRTLSLDRNAYFNKVTTVYEGVDSPTPIVAGIVVHADKPEGYALLGEADAIAVTDLSDNVSADNGEIYVAAIVPGADTLRYMPFDEIKANAVGQALAETTYTPGKPFTYYWGSGWSKGSVADSTAWNEIIAKTKKQIDNPLIVKCE